MIQSLIKTSYDNETTIEKVLQYYNISHKLIKYNAENEEFESN